jgi:hypothetical protein
MCNLFQFSTKDRKKTKKNNGFFFTVFDPFEKHTPQIILSIPPACCIPNALTLEIRANHLDTGVDEQ